MITPGKTIKIILQIAKLSPIEVSKKATIFNQFVPLLQGEEQVEKEKRTNNRMLKCYLLKAAFKYLNDGQ